VLTCKQN